MRTFFYLTCFVGLTLWPVTGLGQEEVLRFRLLPRESEVLASIVDPFGQTVTGRLTLREGETQGKPGDLKRTGRVKVAMETASYDSGLGLRDGDVRDNYLEAADYPLITFAGTAVDEAIEPAGPRPFWRLTLSGILELHGVKREIQVPVRVIREGNKITAEGSMTIALKDFNLAVPTLLFLLRSGETVEVKFRFVGERRP